MRPLILILVGLFLITKIYAQSDSVNSHVGSIRPYFETGISFFNNDYLKGTFKTNSLYNLGFGLRFGNPNKGNILPFFQYSRSSFNTQLIDINNKVMDTSINIKEFIFGLNIAIKKINSNSFRIKIGYIASLINQNIPYEHIDAKGLYIGFGYEAKVFKNSRVFIGYSYDFLKKSSSLFRDYDIQKIAFGFIL